MYNEQLQNPLKIFISNVYLIYWIIHISNYFTIPFEFDISGFDCVTTSSSNEHNTLIVFACGDLSLLSVSYSTGRITCQLYLTHKLLSWPNGITCIIVSLYIFLEIGNIRYSIQRSKVVFLEHSKPIRRFNFSNTYNKNELIRHIAFYAAWTKIFYVAICVWVMISLTETVCTMCNDSRIPYKHLVAPNKKRFTESTCSTRILFCTEQPAAWHISTFSNQRKTALAL